MGPSSSDGPNQPVPEIKQSGGRLLINEPSYLSCQLCALVEHNGYNVANHRKADVTDRTLFVVSRAFISDVAAAADAAAAPPARFRYLRSF